MPWLQAGEVRRNVHGKNLYRASSSFTCDTGYLSFKQQAGACVQASNDIDTLWGGRGIIITTAFIAIIIHSFYMYTIYNMLFVYACMFAVQGPGWLHRHF